MTKSHPALAAFLLGLISATGFAPLQLWPVTILAVAGVLHLVRTAPSRRQALLRGWTFGLGHFIVGLNWIAHAFTLQDAMPHWLGYGAVVLLSLYLAVYPAAAAGLAWRWGTPRGRATAINPPPLPGEGIDSARDQIVFALVFAAAWIVTEWLRATLFTGFAWNPLGVVLVPTIALALPATLIGTYGLSGLLALFCGLIAPLVTSLRRRASTPAARVGPAALAILLAPTALIILALVLLVPPVSKAGPDQPLVRIVQPNIDQSTKYDPRWEGPNFEKLVRLTGAPAAEPRLIFWPEAAVDAILDQEPAWRYQIAGLMRPGDLIMSGGVKLYWKNVITGGFPHREVAAGRNSLWVIDARGRLLHRYDKAHLVPYGEYLPMPWLLRTLGLSRLVPGDVDFLPGPGPQSYALPGFARKMGVQICYEIIFSGQVVDATNRPDFLFNPSNDAWFGAWGPPQHLAQARLRAIEEAMPILRSTPTGISALIDARGHLLASIPHEQPGFIEARLPHPQPPTLFARFGNSLPALFALVLLIQAVAIARRAR